MPMLQARIQPLERDVQALLSDLSDPQQRSLALAEFARSEIADAKTINRQILGREPPSKLFVDGIEGAALESVQPGGIIVVDFELIEEVLRYVDQQLRAHSPVVTGRYQRSHTLFADGTQVSAEADLIPQAEEYVFLSLVPYARKIERGSSAKAPEGVYQVVAVLAQRKFGSLARITFSYRTAIRGGIIGGRLGNRAEQRSPAIVIRQKV